MSIAVQGHGVDAEVLRSRTALAAKWTCRVPRRTTRRMTFSNSGSSRYRDQARSEDLEIAIVHGPQLDGQMSVSL